MPRTRILFTSDLRSNSTLYAELVEYVDKTGPQIVLLGGDLFGGDPREQTRFARGPFEEVLGQLTARGVVGVGVLPGNDDWSSSLDALHDSEFRDNLHFVSEQTWELEHAVNIVGYGYTPLTPFSVKDHEKLDHYRPDKREILEAQATGVASGAADVARVRRRLDGAESIEKDLATLDTSIRAGRTIFLSHCPPRNTQLDLAYGRHAGSQAVRDFLGRTRPAISLHGHISQLEQRHGEFAEWLNDTLMVNPGQGTPLHAVVFDAERPAESLEHTLLGAWHDPHAAAALQSTARQSPDA